MRKKILYISTNDGSDTRINKEVKTLAKTYDVLFLGVGAQRNFFLKPYCTYCLLVKGKRNHPLTLLQQVWFAFRMVLKYRHISIHVVNEQLAIFFYPLLLVRHTVIDVFDSIFLTKGMSPNEWLWLKRIIYFPANVVIVTDENRRGLMPDFLQKKIAVIPNYPFYYSSLETIKMKTNKDYLTILFFGWLGMARGGKQAKELLELSDNIKIIMIGWFSDEETKVLVEHERVDYRGVIPQIEALNIAATEADYILCLYEPSNLNTVNASPNKIYDSIQTHTPVIINREVKASKIVENLQTGIIIEDYYKPLTTEFIDLLFQSKDTFLFSKELSKKYTWDGIEKELINLHK